MARTRVYKHGRLEHENFPVADISDHLQDPDSLVWLDLSLPDGDDLSPIVEELNLHVLAVEDALTERQRPKVDRYEEHLFLSAFCTAVDADNGTISLAEVSAFVTAQALVTVRKSHEFDVDQVVERWDASPDLAKSGVSFLVHGLLDYIVDSHFSAVETLDDQIEALEDLLFDERARDVQVQRRTFQLRKSLVVLRKVALPMREVVNSLMRRDLEFLDPSMTPYYQDVYDHVLRATEWTESLRDLVTTVLETNLTIQGNRLNMIMKKLTGWAAVIAVPTAVTGFYGQNLPFPGYEHWGGFITSSIILVTLSVGLFVMFRRNDWI